MANSPQMEIPQFVYSKVDGHLGCFYLSATVNSAAMNIHIVSMEEHAPAPSDQCRRLAESSS